MASRKSKDETPTAVLDLEDRIASLESGASIAGIAGPGRWLVAEYQPTALFSLKMSLATSSVGKTLLVPTPYAIKMAVVDAAFRARCPDSECENLLRALRQVDVRVAPGSFAVVTHTFVKVRQEPKVSSAGEPYIASIAYRELVHYPDSLRWAFDLATCNNATAERLAELFPYICYIGKRGSFVQFRGYGRVLDLSSDYTLPVPRGGTWNPPARAHIAALDDFGPDADLETLSSFTQKRPKRNQHRRFVETIVPIGIVNTGPGFTEYGRE